MDLAVPPPTPAPTVEQAELPVRIRIAVAQEPAEVLGAARETVSGGVREAACALGLDRLRQPIIQYLVRIEAEDPVMPACSTANCFWLRKPSNGRTSTRAPAASASSRVASVEPESTTRISSQNASDARQAPMRSASL